MPETQLGIGPARLGAELLQDERLEQVAETIAAIMPVFCGEFGERGGQTAVEEMHLRRLDEPLRFVPMPRLQAADEVEALARGEMVFDRVAAQIEFVAERGDVEQLAGAQGQKCEQSREVARVFDAGHVLHIALQQGAQIVAVPVAGADG